MLESCECLESVGEVLNVTPAFLGQLSVRIARGHRGAALDLLGEVAQLVEGDWLEGVSLDSVNHDIILLLDFGSGSLILFNAHVLVEDLLELSQKLADVNLGRLLGLAGGRTSGRRGLEPSGHWPWAGTSNWRGVWRSDWSW